MFHRTGGRLLTWGRSTRCFYYKQETYPGGSVILRRLATKNGEEPSSLVLLRHGQSLWNKIPTFTGWCDIPLTAKGVEQAEAAGKLLFDRGYVFDLALTSRLKRASETCEMALRPQNPDFPFVRAWQFNERHYGSLQGRAKNDPQLFAEYGEEQLISWRREFFSTPPAMDSSHSYYEPPPAPLTESLADCQSRVLKYWKEDIVPQLSPGKKVLLVAHSNTIRGLVAYFDDVSPTDIPHIHIPNSVPFVYQIDPATGDAIQPTDSPLSKTKGHWLLNPENQKRLIEKLGADSESFARSVFDAWDTNNDGILSQEELFDGLAEWKNGEDRALGALAGKLLEEFRKEEYHGPIAIAQFQEHARASVEKHNLPFFLLESQ